MDILQKLLSILNAVRHREYIPCSNGKRSLVLHHICKMVLLPSWQMKVMFLVVLVKGHQHWWLAGSYDLEIEHF